MGDIDGFNEYADLYKGAYLNADAPVKLLDSGALYDRIELNQIIKEILDATPLKGKYKTNNHLAEIQVWWQDNKSRHRDLRIHKQGEFYVSVDYNKDFLKLPTFEGLIALINNLAQGNYEAV